MSHGGGHVGGGGHHPGGGHHNPGSQPGYTGPGGRRPSPGRILFAVLFGIAVVVVILILGH